MRLLFFVSPFRSIFFAQRFTESELRAQQRLNLLSLLEWRLSFLLAQLAQSQRVVSGVQLVLSELGLAPLEILDVLLQDPALILHAFLLFRNTDFHVVEFRVELVGKI